MNRRYKSVQEFREKMGLVEGHVVKLKVDWLEYKLAVIAREKDGMNALYDTNSGKEIVSFTNKTIQFGENKYGNISAVILKDKETGEIDRKCMGGLLSEKGNCGEDDRCSGCGMLCDCKH